MMIYVCSYRPAPANKSLGERPQSGTLEVLNPGNCMIYSTDQ